jgi:hypothetical protein
LSAIRTGQLLPPGRFLVLICVQRLRRSQGHSAAGMIRLAEKSNDLMGNQTCDLLACSSASTKYATALPLYYTYRWIKQTAMQIRVPAGNKNKCSSLHYKIFLSALRAYKNVAILHQIVVTQYTNRWMHTLATQICQPQSLCRQLSSL